LFFTFVFVLNWFECAKVSELDGIILIKVSELEFSQKIILVFVNSRYQIQKSHRHE